VSVNRIRCRFSVCRLQPNDWTILVHLNAWDLFQNHITISNDSARVRPSLWVAAKSADLSSGQSTLPLDHSEMHAGMFWLSP
jgi:hypothetical protein